MTVEQILQKEIEESKTWFDRENDGTTYKRDLQKRIELINRVLENINNSNVQICGLIESKMNEIVDKINQADSAIEEGADSYHRDVYLITSLAIVDILHYYVLVWVDTDPLLSISLFVKTVP
jgi:hypothetical protein